MADLPGVAGTPPGMAASTATGNAQPGDESNRPEAQEERDLVKDIKHRIERAKKFRKPYEEQWKQLAHKFAGRWHKGRSKMDRVAVNKLFALVQTRLPSVVFRDPEYNLPHLEENPQIELLLRNAEGLLNHTARQLLHLEVELRRQALSAMVIAHGYVKTTWAPAFRTDTATGLSFDFGRPISRWRNSFTVYLDPEPDRYEDCSYIAEKFIRPMDALRASGLYRPEALAKVKPTLTFSANESSELAPGMPIVFQKAENADDDPKARKSDQRVELHEFWDLTAGKLYVVADGLDDMFLRCVPIPLPYDNPYDVLAFNDDLLSMYWIADTMPVERLNDELNLIRQRQVNATSKILPKYLVPKDGNWKTSTLQNLASGVVGGIFRVPDPDKVKAAPIPSLPGDNMNLNKEIRTDIEDVWGGTSYDGGAGSNETATQATLREEGSRSLLAYKLRLVELNAVSIGRKIGKLWSTFGDVKQIVRDVSRKSFLSIVPSSIPVQLWDAMEVTAGSTAAPNDERDALRIGRVFTLVQANPVVNLPPLVMELMRRNGLHNVERFINPVALQQYQAMAALGPVPGPGAAQVPTEGIPSAPNAPAVKTPGMPAIAAPATLATQPVPTRGDVLSAAQGAAHSVGA